MIKIRNLQIVKINLIYVNFGKDNNCVIRSISSILNFITFILANF